MGVAGATVAAAGISAGAGLLGSSMQSNAVGKGSREANLLQLIALDRTRGDLGPYNAAGQTALGPAGMASGVTGEDNALFNRNTVLGMSGVLGEKARLGAPVQNVAGQMAGIYGEDQRLASPVQNIAGELSGIYGPEAAAAAMQNFQASPGYQFRLNEGMRAVDAQQAARGMLRSGATLKAEQEYAQGLASDEYGKYMTNAGNQFTGAYSRAGDQFTGDYNRASSAFGDYYNRLFSLAGLGESAAAQQGAANINTGTGMAQTAASGAATQAGIIGNEFKGIQTGVNNLFNSQAVQDQVKSWLAPSTPVNSPLYSETGARL